MPSVPNLRTLATSLKVRISLASGLLVLAAVAIATGVVLRVVDADAQAAAIELQRDAAERGAHEVGERVADRMQLLAAIARTAPHDVAADPERAGAWLLGQAVSNRLFGSVFVALPDGRVTARVEGGVVPRNPVSIADRAYFARALETRAPVMSDALRTKASGSASVVAVHPVLDPAGAVGTVVGVRIDLTGSGGLAEMAPRGGDASVTVIVDRSRRVVAHADTRRLLESAEALPELREVLARHGASMRGDDPRGGRRVGDRIVGWSPVPDTDWILFEVSDAHELMAAVRDTRERALVLTTTLALLAALGMFLLCSLMFRPIGRLRDRAQRVLIYPDDIEHGWPHAGGEVGELSRVFQHILRERAASDQASLRMLTRLQAILDNASMGIAFTRDGRFELVSPSLAALTGYRPDELIGVPIQQLARDADEFSATVDRMNAALAEHARFDEEVRIVRKDRTRRWVRVIASAIDRSRPEAGTIWIAEDVSEKRQLRRQLSWSASRDPLTSLLNRREFEARLEQALADPRRPPGAVLFLDLDRFKQVNDTGGHPVGDRMLCDLARLIESKVRRGDSVARLGGDEFAVLLPECPEPVAHEIAERIRDAIRRHELHEAGLVHTVGVSVGIGLTGAPGATPAQVVQAADRACYAAKHAGRGERRAARAADAAAVAIAVDPR